MCLGCWVRRGCGAPAIASPRPLFRSHETHLPINQQLARFGHQRSRSLYTLSLLRRIQTSMQLTTLGAALQLVAFALAAVSPCFARSGAPELWADRPNFLSHLTADDALLLPRRSFFCQQLHRGIGNLLSARAVQLAHLLARTWYGWHRQWHLAWNSIQHSTFDGWNG